VIRLIRSLSLDLSAEVFGVDRFLVKKEWKLLQDLFDRKG
jgi:hypothetical protein